jgi:hypothetical protein
VLRPRSVGARVRLHGAGRPGLCLAVTQNRIGVLYREYVKPKRTPHDEAEQRNEFLRVVPRRLRPQLRDSGIGYGRRVLSPKPVSYLRPDIWR